MQYKYLNISINPLRKMIAIVQATVFLLSCDFAPVDYIDESKIFTSVERLDNAALGVYEAWYPEYIIRISSLITDECAIGAQNLGLDAIGQSIFRWTFSSDDDDVLAPWANGYKVIGRVNKILEKIDTVPVRDEEEEQKKSSIKGELLAIRAFVHFDLYRVYGYSGIYDATAPAVPYMKICKMNSQPSRPDTGSFFSDLWHDIEEAESLKPVNDVIRVGMTAIECLHARVALYAEKYQEAADYAGKVIHKIALTSSTEFPLLWDDNENGEIIFKLKRSKVNDIRPGDLFYKTRSDKVLFTPSRKLLDMYDIDSDVRYKSWYAKSSDDSSLYLITKYTGTNENRNLNDVKMLRVSEMYLIRAEALLRSGKHSVIYLASKDLNDLRAHRISNYKNENFFNNPDSLLNAIIEERFKELPYEGHRYFDLKRLGKSIERTANSAASSDILDVASPCYFIPIPQSEVLSNPNIRPNNKGW